MTTILSRCLALFLIAVIPAISAAEEAPDVPLRILEQFDVFTDGDFLIVPVEAFGKTNLFALDTGCPGIMFDRRLRAFLGEPAETVTAPGANAPVAIELFDPPRARVGSLALNTTSRVGCIDFSEIRKGTGHALAGIVGMDFLRQYVIHIDFDSGTLAFLNKCPRDAGVAVPIHWTNGIIPTVEVAIAGHGSEKVVIDTGWVSPCLASFSTSVMDALERDGAAQGSGSATNIDGSGKTAVMKLRSVKQLGVASFDFSNVPVTNHKLHKANILGLDFLTRFIVTFDFPNGVIYLKKSKRFDVRARPPWAGIELYWQDGKVIVQTVASGSPAAHGGIKANDVLLRVGDHEATTLRLFEIKELLCSPDSLRLELQRGEEKFRADLHLPESKKNVGGESVAR